MSKSKFNLRVLKVKRAGLFFFGLAFFLFPVQSLSDLVFNWQVPKTRQLALNLPDPAAYPINSTSIKAPWLTADGAVVIDENSGVVIYSKNENTHLLPASTTKIMTALVALESYGQSDILTVNRVNNFGQDMELFLGERMTVKNLLYGTLVYSANDAAWVLAQNYPGGETEFIKVMNNKAKVLHLENTHFANPTGVNSDEKGRFLTDFSYTTALDLAQLSREALKNPDFVEIVATKKITVYDITGKFKHELFNINELLGKVEGLGGIKTGWTEDAGGCLAAYVQRNGQGIITVVLGSDDRFGESEKLINWVFNNFQWEDLTFTIPST